MRFCQTQPWLELKAIVQQFVLKGAVPHLTRESAIFGCCNWMSQVQVLQMLHLFICHGICYSLQLLDECRLLMKENAHSGHC